MVFFSSVKSLFCIFVIALSFSNAKLVIKSPEDLGRQIGANGIEYTILTPQNKITYKRIFIGSLTLPEPHQRNACNPLPSLSGLSADAVYNPVLLTTWGDCHYAQKVKNAEIAGAKMVILVLKHDLEANHALVRQLPISTSVEVLCISASDGEILIKYLDEHPRDPVELTYSYEVEKHVNFQAGPNVMLDFWFSSGDLSKASYNFLDTLNEILQNFDKHVKFNPRYVVWNYDDGATSDDPKCISNGKYCDPERLTEDRLSGKETIYEDLRQICLKEDDAELDLNSEWWKYVSAFGEKCIDKGISDLNSCRSSIFETLSSNTEKKVQHCVESSFTNDENRYLQKEVEDRDKMSVDHYPAFYVNKERYTGSFRNKYAIKEFICSHFVQDQIPETCIASVNSTQTTTSSSSDTLLYILIVILSIVIMALMLYCVRRSVKRQVMTRMNDEISHIVTQYKQFKDKSNSFSADEEM